MTLRAAFSRNNPASTLTLANVPWVERAEVQQNGFDRALLDTAGRLLAAVSPLRRLRLRRFARRVMAQDAVLQAESGCSL